MISCFWLTFLESYKNNQQDAIQNAYFGNQCFGIGFSISFTACCSILTLTGKLKTVMLSWSLRDRTTRELHQWAVWNRLLPKSKASTVNVMKICTCGEMKWGFNSGLILFLNCWRVPFCQTNGLCGSIINRNMGKVPWMVLGISEKYCIQKGEVRSSGYKSPVGISWITSSIRTIN